MLAGVFGRRSAGGARRGLRLAFLGEAQDVLGDLIDAPPELGIFGPDLGRFLLRLGARRLELALQARALLAQAGEPALKGLARGARAVSALGLQRAGPA